MSRYDTKGGKGEEEKQEKVSTEMELSTGNTTQLLDSCQKESRSGFSRSDEVLKLKNFKKDASLKLSSYQIKKGKRDTQSANICKTGKESCHDIILTTSLNLKVLLKQLTKRNFIKEGFGTGIGNNFVGKMFRTSQRTIYSLFTTSSFDTDEGLRIRKYFITYTKTDVPLFHDKLVQHMESLRESIQERAKHKQEYDRKMNDRMMQSKEGKVDSSKALDAGWLFRKQ
ncbi:hypothetical protein Tco_0414865 [Tanacetum coccineum]